MGIDQSVKPSATKGMPRSVQPNVDWLRRQMQVRCWSLAQFAHECMRTGEPVSTATISGALNGNRIDRRKYASMVAAIQVNEPLLPEEAIA